MKGEKGDPAFGEPGARGQKVCCKTAQINEGSLLETKAQCYAIQLIFIATNDMLM